MTDFPGGNSLGDYVTAWQAGGLSNDRPIRRKVRVDYPRRAACPGVRLTAKGTRTFVAPWTDPATRRKVREPPGVWDSLTLDQAREADRWPWCGNLLKGQL